MSLIGGCETVATPDAEWCFAPALATRSSFRGIAEIALLSDKVLEERWEEHRSNPCLGGTPGPPVGGRPTAGSNDRGDPTFAERDSNAGRSRCLRLERDSAGAGSNVGPDGDRICADRKCPSAILKTRGIPEIRDRSPQRETPPGVVGNPEGDTVFGVPNPRHRGSVQ